MADVGGLMDENFNNNTHEDDMALADVKDYIKKVVSDFKQSARANGGDEMHIEETSVSLIEMCLHVASIVSVCHCGKAFYPTMLTHSNNLDVVELKTWIPPSEGKVN